MAVKGRTPIPKSQKEISNGLIDPYDTSRGNPNTTEKYNRGDKVSFRDDTTKPFSIGIKDIDESIMYMEKQLKIDTSMILYYLTV